MYFTAFQYDLFDLVDETSEAFMCIQLTEHNVGENDGTAAADESGERPEHDLRMYQSLCLISTGRRSCTGKVHQMSQGS